ncbi:DUF6766 family protein [Tessaracoccus sp. Y36]|uniref:DUF6766 family protein n=1 Tax=Tessaracoccus sp. MC1756 TaxID=2760311 RepID=UPI001600D174|nr:hypothetical protein [Tessaracoccus sp. MC1756]
MKDPRVQSALRDNSLSIGFGILLLLALIGQAFAGQAHYNLEARTAGLAEIDMWRYLTSSSFAVDVAENWQSEYLQFTLFILLTVWLVQRGSSESKPPQEMGPHDDSEEMVGEFARPDSPQLARVGGWRTSVFSMSLTIVMFAIFVLSWAAQAVAGRVAYNEERLRDLLDPLSLGDYLLQPEFWSRTFQNWQSEFLAVGSMAIFAVFLRQRNSPESKPVGMPHHENP